ncbi:Mur ligase [Martensiomyces pterosporus]|nr:Mur ligase [Martensiomyces pterosporus]
MATPESVGKINLGLGRITTFFEHTLPSDPRAKLRVIHIAGTNGKGSVCALISEALMAAGYKVGTFNSPHFLEPSDAARIQGMPVPTSEYAELREWISSLDTNAPSEEGPLSLFEQATVAAIWWFAKNDVDVAVIEVGMGGLRDATNVFGTSLVQCICPIDEDHLGMIGNNVEEIAREKSGIMRPGSWIVVGNQERTEAFHTVRQIAHSTSPGRIINYPPSVAAAGAENGKEQVPKTVELDLPLMLPGYYQADNASVAFYALDILRAHYAFDRLTDAAIQVGFQNVRWPGRLAWLRLTHPITPTGSASSSAPANQNNANATAPSSTQSSSGGGGGQHAPDSTDPLSAWILADGAHNEPAAAELRRYINATLRRIAQQRYLNVYSGSGYKDTTSVRWVVGFTKGKDVSGILRKLVRPGDSVWAVPFTQPDEMPWIQCTDPTEIQATARGVIEDKMTEISKFDSLAEAVQRLNGDKSDKYLTVLCGSLYLVADLYRELHVRPFDKPA